MGNYLSIWKINIQNIGLVYQRLSLSTTLPVDWTTLDRLLYTTFNDVHLRSQMVTVLTWT